MADAYRPRGLFFEEFEPGKEMVSVGRTITEADIVTFSGVSGDYTALHTDAEYAKGTPFGERIAHGMLVLSVATGLAAQLGFMEGTVMAFAGLEWKFKAPVKIGDTVRVATRVKQTKAVPAAGGGMVVFDVRVLNQRDQAVQQGEWTILAKGKS